MTEDSFSDLDVACGESFDAGDELCVHITGSGASTSVDVWTNPAAGTPDDFGTPDCTLTANLSVDTGNIIGVTAASSDVGTSDFIEFDDFRGGSCVP